MYVYIHMYKMVLDQVLAVCKGKIRSIPDISHKNQLPGISDLNVKYEPIQGLKENLKVFCIHMGTGFLTLTQYTCN